MYSTQYAFSKDKDIANYEPADKPETRNFTRQLLHLAFLEPDLVLMVPLE